MIINPTEGVVVMVTDAEKNDEICFKCKIFSNMYEQKHNQPFTWNLANLGIDKTKVNGNNQLRYIPGQLNEDIVSDDLVNLVNDLYNEEVVPLFVEVSDNNEMLLYVACRHEVCDLGMQEMQYAHIWRETIYAIGKAVCKGRLTTSKTINYFPSYCDGVCIITYS